MQHHGYAIPVPPVIPVSNASYAKVVGRIIKAGKVGDPVAVEAIRDEVRGTNTYARKVRAYADSVRASLGAGD